MEGKEILLATSKNRRIKNFQDSPSLTFRRHWGHPKEFPLAHQRTDCSPIYNCHGLTFASRRTWIDPSEIEKILVDDEWKIISSEKVLPGDMVLYFSPDGEVEHSGIVLEVDSDYQLHKICSKWAWGPEFVHRVNHSPYKGTYQFFRCQL